MAILTIGQRLEAMDKFIAHWTAVNAALAPAELTLSAGYTLAGGFIPEREAVRQSQADVVARENALSLARAERDDLRNRLIARFKQFRAAVNAYLPGSTYLASIPDKPMPASSAGEWRDACSRLENLWAEIDENVPPVAGFVPPLLLAGGYSLADFVSNSQEVQDAFSVVSHRTLELRVARGVREEVYRGPHARMVQYRLAVLGSFDTSNTLVLTLPAVTPSAN